MPDKFSKKIKFALRMPDKAGIGDKEVRTLQELQENFDLERILNFFLDGKLQEWLSDRYYSEQAAEISWDLGEPEKEKKEDGSPKRANGSGLWNLLLKWEQEQHSDDAFKELDNKVSEVIGKYSMELQAERKKYWPKNPEPLVREIIIKRLCALLCKDKELPRETDVFDERYNLFLRQKYVVQEDRLAFATDDREAIEHCMEAVLTQDELKKRIKKGQQDGKTIYLVKNGDEEKYGYDYTIDATWSDWDFIGVDKPTVRVVKKETDAETGAETEKILIERFATDRDKKCANLLTEQKLTFRKLLLQVLKTPPPKMNGDESNEPWEPLPENNDRYQYVDFGDTQKRKRETPDANSAKAVKARLVRYMDSCFPLIYFNTYEEDKADEIISSLAGNRTIWEWNAEGFFEKSDGKYTGRKRLDWPLHDALHYLIREYQICAREMSVAQKNRLSLNRAILVLKDANRLLEDDDIVAWLKYLAQLIYNGAVEDCNIIIISPVIHVPKELENYLTVVRLDYLSDNEIKDLIEKFCVKQEIKSPEGELLEDFVAALKGLSEFDILNILALAMADDKEINQADLAMIQKQKRNTIMKSNLLEAVSVKEDEEDIGGLENLKQWLTKKATVFDRWKEARNFGVDMPKGVLIAGMPGCGKSLSAKVTAAMFDMPLFRMDMGRLMGKYVGESEANMRQVLKLVDAMAPCVFWIDEMEKAFAGVNSSEGSGEITTRLLGTFLTWMQEKTSRVFVVATANKVQNLPAELLRKGRFDEVFYIGMPNAKEREQIFRIHLGKRRDALKDGKLDEITIETLVSETRGYSGADIEGVVRESVETAFVEKRLRKGENAYLTTEDIRKAIKKTHPLAVIMQDSIAKLSLFYKKNKFKSANSDDSSFWDNIKTKFNL